MAELEIVALGHPQLPLGLASFDTPLTASDLVADLLTPKPALPAELLGSCQRSWRRPTNLAALMQVSEHTRLLTKLSLARSLTSGEVDMASFTETSAADVELTAKNSSSLQREPASYADFVRGRPTFKPFVPGGLPTIGAMELEQQAAAAAAAAESLQDLDDILGLNRDLHSVPPGFNRGIVFEGKCCGLQWLYGSVMPNFHYSASKDASDLDLSQLLAGDDELLAQLLSDQQPPDAEPEPETADQARTHLHRFPEFHDLVPELAHSFPFELDVFQKRAVYHLENSESVFIAAHTSAGKTVVAEYAIALAQKHMTRAIYTSPIKALSNQKFRDFRETFGDVGILTGDVQIKPEASCLVMTTEILRSMLYRGADLIRDVEFVIFDEVHYVNDAERGVVWEEVIIMLPSHINLILLSATVPNTKEFADWVGRTKQKDIYVISTLKRPVPLEHHLYVDKEIYKIVDASKTFLAAGYKKAYEVLHPPKKEVTRQDAGRGRGGPADRGGRGRGSRGGASGAMQAYNNSQSRGSATDKNIYTHLINMLKKRTLLPAIIFTFSKRKCEEYANALVNADLTLGASEKSEIHVFIEKSLTCLKGSDRELPQVMRMRDLLGRGIAVHHSGLLPILKEIVEILFTRGLVKVLFATETFAMGVNAPAKSVVFSMIRKHDGTSFRNLLPGEYTQMSGRAGRRGLDDTGMVIIACSDDIPDQPTLSSMILGTPTKLASQFRITYNMILNLLRVEAIKVEDMIKRSFSENVNQKALPDQQRRHLEASSAALSAKTLESLKRLDCTICSADVYPFYDICARILTLGYQLHEKIVRAPIGQRALSTGRVVVVNNTMFRNALAVVLRSATGEQGTLPVTRISVPTRGREADFIELLPYTAIAVITPKIVKLDVERIIEQRDASEIATALGHLQQLAEEIQAAGSIPEYDWSKIREADFQDGTREKHALMRQLDGFQCTRCPDLIPHYGLVHRERMLQQQVAELAISISDQNLELLPDYHQRVDVLKVLGFVDANAIVQIKGRINTADELILTELILDNFFAEYEPAEIVALLSCFVFQEKSQSEPVLTLKLEKGVKRITELAVRIAEVQEACGLGVRKENALDSIKFGLVEVVYEWARGLPFKHITDLTDVLEGSIVRCIVRLSETCREVSSAARQIGDAGLYRKMEEAAELIRRDIVFAASLYF
ncbi:Antiviral helicase ski2 [Polyrhizophydium stewartii]|uniref:Antiviral helicase ski2 n=1 Tax=Polyrhizophydium stewartii TaxID=2732419 RepID=A0ABR4NF85_9FUNG